MNVPSYNVQNEKIEWLTGIALLFREFLDDAIKKYMG
jgi:hypothetical protein